MYRMITKKTNRTSKPYYYSPKNQTLFDLSKLAHAKFTIKNDIKGALANWHQAYMHIIENEATLNTNDKIYILNKYLVTLGRQWEILNQEHSNMLSKLHQNDALTDDKQQTLENEWLATTQSIQAVTNKLMANIEKITDLRTIENTAIKQLKIANLTKNLPRPYKYHHPFLVAVANSLCHIGLTIKQGTLLDAGINLYNKLKIKHPSITNEVDLLNFEHKRAIAKNDMKLAQKLYSELHTAVQLLQTPSIKLVVMRRKIKSDLYNLHAKFQNHDITRAQFAKKLPPLFKAFWKVYDLGKHSLDSKYHKIKQFADNLSILFLLCVTKNELEDPNQPNVAKADNYINYQITKLHTQKLNNSNVVKELQAIWQSRVILLKKCNGVYQLEHKLYGTKPATIDINALTSTKHTKNHRPDLKIKKQPEKYFSVSDYAREFGI